MYLASVISTFKDIWKDIKIDRELFEAAPDRGFFGKYTARIFNLFYNYVIMLIIVDIFFVLICYSFFIIFCIVVFIFLLVFSLAFGPIISPLYYIFEIFIVDFDRESTTNWRSNYYIFPLFSELFFNLFYFGIAQIFMSIIWLVLHPLLAIFWLVYGIVKYVFLMIKDFFMWGAIRCCARVPDYETCIAWRVSSP